MGRYFFAAGCPRHWGPATVSASLERRLSQDAWTADCKAPLAPMDGFLRFTCLRESAERHLIGAASLPRTGFLRIASHEHERAVVAGYFSW